MEPDMRFRIKTVKKSFLITVTKSLLVLLFIPMVALAQNKTITVRGFVTDSTSGEKLPGANMLLKSVKGNAYSQGTVSDPNGYYIFTDITPGDYDFTVTYIGYKKLHQTLRFNGKNFYITHSIKLAPTKSSLGEVVVTGVSHGATTMEAGRQNISSVDISKVPTPSVSGDLASYLQAMPSVVTVGDRGGQLYIRGGTPDQNLILMDKIQVYRPFHMVGFYSAFPQDLVSTAKVYAGGFPAQYSGRMSSVIDVTMRGGNQKHFVGAATLGPFLAGVRAEGPLNNHGLSVLADGRFSQIERTAPLFLGEDEPIKFEDQFFKLQSATATSNCGLTVLHTYDRGKIDPQRNDVFEWTNFGIGGHCTSFVPGSSTLVNLNASYSFVQNGVGQGNNPARDAKLWSLVTNVDLSAPTVGTGAIQGGFHLHVDNPSYSLGEEFQGFRSGTDNLMGFTGYLQMKIPIGKNMDLNPGLSVDGTFDYGFSVEPRFRASWRPFGTEKEEVDAALGVYRQTIVGITDERDIGSAFTAWIPVPLSTGRPYAIHAILGWRQQLGNVGLTVEGFYKKMAHLAVPIWSAIARFTTQLTSASGKVYGVDARLEYSHGPIYAYIGYGYSWTEYYAEQANFGIWFGTSIESYHPPFDQRHSLNVLFSDRLGFATFDIRWQFATGLPYTQPFGFDSYIPLHSLQLPTKTYGTLRLLYNKPYDARLPAYNRLDVSLERVFKWSKGTSLLTKVGAINVYDRKNLFYYDLFTLRRINQLPLIPYIAIQVTVN